MVRAGSFNTALPSRTVWRRWAALLLAATLVAGCGGGLFIGFGCCGDDIAPSVQLVADVSSAAPGAAVELIAAAADENGIDSIAFYRLDASGNAFLLGTDGSSPYHWSTTIPIGAAGSVRYFARATDIPGNRADSNIVTVNVAP